jgi:hypothetical protein
MAALWAASFCGLGRFLAGRPSSGLRGGVRGGLGTTLRSAARALYISAENQTALVEEAQLVGGGGPNLLQGVRVQGRAVGYDLIWLYARTLEAREEVLNVVVFDPPVVDQLVAHEAVAAFRGRRIDRQQQCQFILVDLG